jgi:chemotaxis protein histidine kinase CheA
VHRIVTDYNGRIDVQSAPGQGTTIITRFPAVGAPLTPVTATLPTP